MRPRAVNSYFHCGDLGDVISFLPVMRQLGGGRLVLGNWQGRGGREPMTQERFDAIAPLLKLQPYITEVAYEHDAKDITHSTVGFRQTAVPRLGEAHTLVSWHGDYFKIPEVDTSPWLTVPCPSEETKGKTIFCRTKRYQNPKFSWRQAADRYQDAIFIGFQDEHQAMCLSCGRSIPWRKTQNLLEVAELIAGSDRVISNQTVHWWIAFALNVPTMQESDPINLNSMIRRENSQYFLGAYP
jgi:hypothetical protein